ncbi:MULTISPECIES: LLM class flavin-dependent oxidoreductase [unclassified Variovorax]|uniref:LLM class flavin-dependent oxidoreductase n=1 Tax=unclassified Variovorax TaxID=663243 RepID=UPI001BD4A4D1|nr:MULTISPECIES: LLM class flavin-dependent oxidoreductase [unclassified Variovorax]
MSTIQRAVDVGVFIPVGNNGWIASTNAPKVPGSYEHNLQVTLLAERLGFDFVLSMAKWRGYGGPSKHWDVTLESLTTMAGLAQATKTIDIWGTVHMMIFPPAIVAKMVATLDQISGGRVGLNLVSGSNPHDLGQLGLWKPLDHAGRYELADEWIRVVKRLWSEDRVDHKGTFFELNDCMSNPKPSKRPTIICAGASDRGFQFTIDNCDASFFTASDDDASIARGKRAKELAVRAGKPDFKSYGLFMVVPGRTDAEAQARLDRFDAGVDREALATQTAEYSSDVSAKQNFAAQFFIDQGARVSSVLGGTLTGSAESLARRMARTIVEGELDGVTLIVPDFIEDLRFMAEEVFPRMEELGVSTKLGKSLETA